MESFVHGPFVSVPLGASGEFLLAKLAFRLLSEVEGPDVCVHVSFDSIRFFAMRTLIANFVMNCLNVISKDGRTIEDLVAQLTLVAFFDVRRQFVFVEARFADVYLPTVFALELHFVPHFCVFA